MGGEVYIWAPVILGRLYAPRVIKIKKSYAIDKEGYRIEDLKIRLREYEARVYGVNIVINVKADILCLMEKGERRQLKTWQEVINDNIALSAFDYVSQKEEEIEACIKILSSSIQGEKKDNQINTEIQIIYTVIITSYQEVQIMGAEEGDRNDFIEENLPLDIERKIARLAEENYQLKQTLFMYEQDIKSLRQGIKKAERRNSELKEELNHYKKMIGKQETSKITEKDIFSYKKEAYMTPKEIALGHRIKKMFKGE